MNTTPTLAYCPRRLWRAGLLVAKRRVDPSGPGQYRIVGWSGRVYYVDAVEPSCTCPDYECRQMWRDAVCQHILAGLLLERYEPVVLAYGTMLLQRERAMKEHMKRTRPRRALAS